MQLNTMIQPWGRKGSGKGPLNLVRKSCRCLGQRLYSQVGWVLWLLPLSFSWPVPLLPGSEFPTVTMGLGHFKEAAGPQEEDRPREELAWPLAPKLTGNPGC